MSIAPPNPGPPADSNVATAAQESRRPVPAKAQVNLSYLHGFGPLTRISSNFGDIPAQALRERDRVRVKTGEFLQIVKVNRIVLDEEFLSYHPGALPVLIRAGSLGTNLPRKDITLAPYQGIHPGQAFSSGKLARAVDAIGRPNCFRRPEQIITYTQIQLTRPSAVLAEGVWLDVSA